MILANCPPGTIVSFGELDYDQNWRTTVQEPNKNFRTMNPVIPTNDGWELDPQRDSLKIPVNREVLVIAQP